MGLWEVLIKLPQIKSIESLVLANIDRNPPDVAILVDFPGFHFSLAKKLKLRGIKVVQYVAPKLWAWGQKRIVRLRRDFDLVMGVFPFEAEYFTKRNVNFKLVGSPHRDRVDNVVADKAYFGYKEEDILIGFLPGSRVSEVVKILPQFHNIVWELRALLTKFHIVIPVAENLELGYVEGLFRSGLEDMTSNSQIRFIHGSSLKLMKAADVCLVASGTATLECALLGTPLVVIYVMNAISYKLAKKKVQIPWISLVNILMGREVVPEHVQDLNSSKIAKELANLSQKQGAFRLEMLKNFATLTKSLRPNAAESAAETIVEQYIKIDDKKD